MVCEVTQSCPTLCDPMDCSLPGSSLHGILQARVLEWVATSFSRGSSQPRDRTQISHIPGRCFNLWATYTPVKKPNTWLANFLSEKISQLSKNVSQFTFTTYSCAKYIKVSHLIIGLAKKFGFFCYGKKKKTPNEYFGQQNRIRSLLFSYTFILNYT